MQNNQWMMAATFDLANNVWASNSPVRNLASILYSDCGGILIPHFVTQGDSGGPLVCQRCNSCTWYIAGIVSFGPNPCALEGVPGVYSNVLYYEDWILKTTGMPKHSSSCPDNWTEWRSLSFKFLEWMILIDSFNDISLIVIVCSICLQGEGYWVNEKHASQLSLHYRNNNQSRDVRTSIFVGTNIFRCSPIIK